MTSTSQAKCAYRYEPLRAPTSDDRLDIERPPLSSCPHPVAEHDEQRCLFHHHDSDYPKDQFSDQVRSVLADPDLPPRFAGGQMSSLTFANETVTTANGEPIDLRGATIDGDLDLTDATIEIPILLDDATVKGSIIADGARFRAPISMARVMIGRNLEFYGASVDGGLIANDIKVGYVDCRSLVVDGPVVFDGAEFTANVMFAQSAVDGLFSFVDTVFESAFDATALDVCGSLSLDEATVKRDLDLVSSSVSGSLEASKLHVKGETDVRHARIEGSISASESHFEAAADFKGLACRGESLDFAETHFEALVDFSSLASLTTETSFTGASFEGDVWFTHGRIDGDADLSQATFHDTLHLRDATVSDSLSLAEATSTDQAFLHGSTIKGDFAAPDANFTHFQFSADVRGDANFLRTRFDELAVFAKSGFKGHARFDEASFAGHPDFSDTRFAGTASFDRTEFLVEPTFDGTRFAESPDFETAIYPPSSDRDLDDRRRNMILARPETLRHTGARITADKLGDDLIIPAKTSHLIEDDLDVTKLVTAAFQAFEESDWRRLLREPIQTARTAVAQLSDDDALLVFGFSLNQEADTLRSVLGSGSIVAVYSRDSRGIELGHLDPDLSDVDYLVPVPAADEAFESGASVATLAELATAIHRHQRFRTILLGRQDDEQPHVHEWLVPVLVAAAELG